MESWTLALQGQKGSAPPVGVCSHPTEPLPQGLCRGGKCLPQRDPMHREGGGRRGSIPGPHALPAAPRSQQEPGSLAANAPAGIGIYMTNDDEAAHEIVENEL